MNNYRIMLHFKDVWSEYKEMYKEVILPLKDDYNPYWLEIDKVITWSYIYDYFIAYYDNRYIVYNRDIFVKRFKMILQNELVNFYKKVVLIRDDIFKQFKDKQNLGLVIDIKMNQSNTRTATGSTDMTSSSNELESNESTSSTFDDISDKDQVKQRNKVENTGLTKNKSDVKNTGGGSRRGNETHIFNELNHIMRAKVNLGICDFIVKFSGLFNSFYVPEISQNNYSF